jgi:coenzyme F420 hydrogenase subunit beta
MFALEDSFLVGDYKKLLTVQSKGEETPIELFFKAAFRASIIDGLLTCGSGGGTLPALFLKGENLSIPIKGRCFGVNSLLKRAIQKYRLKKLALFAPSCMIDGLNKTQYFGIGCNWTKTAVAIKVGLLCLSLFTKPSQRAKLAHLGFKNSEVERLFYKDGHFFYQLCGGQRVKVPKEVLHNYSLVACRYCLNMASKGADITYVPLEEKKKALLIVRSERGVGAIAKVFKASEGKLKFKPVGEEELYPVIGLLREKMLLNISSITERIELGIATPKWSDDRLRRFYEAWNGIRGAEEGVF